MRIVDVCEVTKPIASPIRNAYIDFSKMTASLVAVVTTTKGDGRLLLPRQGRHGATRRDAWLSRSWLPRGEDEDRRRANRRRPPPHRGVACRDRQRRAARGRRERPLRSRNWHRLRQDAARLSA